MRLAYLAVIACVAFAISGCANDPAVNNTSAFKRGAWFIEAGNDRITNRPVSSAYVETHKVATSNPENPFGLSGDPAQLQLACFKGGPIVRIAFPFKVGSTRTAELGYAFDNRAGHSPEARIVAGFSTVVIENPEEVSRFATGLVRAQSAYLRVRSYGAGRTSAEFEVNGAGEAIAAAYADCPIEKALAQMVEPKKKGKPGQKTTPRKPATVAADDELDEMPPPAPRYRTEEEAAFGQVKSWFRRN